MEPVLPGEGKRLVMKENREAFVEFAVLGRGGSASMEASDVAAL